MYILWKIALYQLSSKVSTTIGNRRKYQSMRIQFGRVFFNYTNKFNIQERIYSNISTKHVSTKHVNILLPS